MRDTRELPDAEVAALAQTWQERGAVTNAMKEPADTVKESVTPFTDTV